MTGGSSARYFDRLAAVVADADRAAFDRGIALVRDAWLAGRQVITLGNGGSALTALHFVTDWNKSIHRATGRPFRGRSLIDNPGLLTAYANDISYQDIFAEQLKDIAQPGDLVIAISSSGESENVIRAVERAGAMGCVTLGLCGFSGGRLAKTAQFAILVAVGDVQLCEDLHAIFGHIVMQTLCRAEA